MTKGKHNDTREFLPVQKLNIYNYDNIISSSIKDIYVRSEEFTYLNILPKDPYCSFTKNQHLTPVS